MKIPFTSLKIFIKKHKILFSILAALFLINYLTLFVLKIIPFKDLNAFQNHAVSTRIYDTNGYIIQILPVEDGLRREWVNYKDIPSALKKYILKAEDKRFYFHHGVDFFAIINAFRQNSSANKTVRGASTITMQLSKMLYPATEQTIKRKVNDITNAWRIEAKLSKRQILELYINNIPFGNNCEGFASAARSFYSKQLNELTNEEIACLCVIPRRPTLYNPITNPQENAQMAFELYKKISSKNNDFEMVQKAANMATWYNYPFLMPHYINFIKETFLSAENKPVPELHLTANLEIQTFAQGILQQALEYAQDSRIANGAILVLDNKTGSVLAWVGNGNFYDSASSGQIDGILVKNQPGSSMKPFLYALALEQKDYDDIPVYYPSMIFADIPKEFGNENVYIPQNFNNRYNGPVRFRIALASSLNVPAVELLDQIGVENYISKLYEMNFQSLRTQEHKVDLGLSLGAGEVTLKELVPAFSTFARDGKYLPLSYTKNAKLENPKQIYTQDTARIICSILSDKGARALAFGYTQTFQTEYPSIFKTGTSNQFQDIVALGATKNFTIGVWMGNFAGQTVIGKTGSSLPGWAAKQILDLLENHIQGSYADKDFPKPEHYTHERICSLSGLRATKACPASVMEYIPENLDLEPCDWHKRKNGETTIVYPSEYQQWIRMYNISGQIDFSSSELQILTPKDNSVFFFSEMNQDLQAIPVEVIGGSEESIYIEFDGKFMDQIQRPFYFRLPVERGNHKCRVFCGNETAEINFVVK